jgi:DNA-directed RNA polymerase subunit RPC12/RpoP
MEAYKSYCSNCKETYFWIGYKTGIGKTAEQLRQMKRDETVCKYCGYTGLKTTLDHESPDGKACDEMGDIVADVLTDMLFGGPERTPPPPPEPPPDRLIKEGGIFG